MENLILVIIFAIIGLVKWIIENRNQNSAAKEPPRRRVDETERRPAESLRPAPSAETPEEERMRRFMEALGLPANEAPPQPARRAAQPKPTPRQVVEEPKREEVSPPVITPRPAVEPKRWGNHPPIPKERKTPQPAPRPQPAPIPAPRPIGTPVAMPSPKPVTSGAPNPFSPLDAFPEIPDAAPTSIAAPPMEIATLEIKPATASAPASMKVSDLRDELRDPAALRRAFVLREILGPPLATKS